VVEPDFHAIISSQFEAGGLFLIAMHPGLSVGDALLAAERLEQIHDPRTLPVGAQGHLLPLHAFCLGGFRREYHVE
jgi:hypothetical protein